VFGAYGFSIKAVKNAAKAAKRVDKGSPGDLSNAFKVGLKYKNVKIGTIDGFP
jgi:hypothetical protein